MAEYQNQEAEKRKLDEQIHQEKKIRDMMRRTHPKSNQDFAILYNELDAWRKSEMAKIKVISFQVLYHNIHHLYYY
jgi:hypothetical protein